MAVTYCGWCPDSEHPNALFHPDGQAEHRRLSDPEIVRIVDQLSGERSMTNENQQPELNEDMAKPVLKQTEVQQECQICFATVPASNIDKHLKFHRDHGQSK
jgi:hypothetical protein